MFKTPPNVPTMRRGYRTTKPHKGDGDSCEVPDDPDHELPPKRVKIGELVEYDERAAIQNAMKYIRDLRDKRGYHRFFTCKTYINSPDYELMRELEIMGSAEMCSLMAFKNEIREIEGVGSHVQQVIFQNMIAVSGYGDTMKQVDYRTKISDDVSQGKEFIPIACYSDVPEPTSLSDVNYIIRNVYRTADFKDGERTANDFKVTCEEGCECDTMACPCYKLQRLGTDSGDYKCCFLPREGRYMLCDSMTYERVIIACCGSACKCSNTCPMKYGGIVNPHQLEVFQRDTRIGYGVRTLTNIAFGELVCEFVGELASQEELEQQEHAVDYAFKICCIDDHVLLNRVKEISKQWIRRSAWKWYNLRERYLNPYMAGNVARWIGHSCFPNMIAVRVIVNDVRPHMHRIFFVATHAIPAGTELTFDYGEHVTSRIANCLCGSIGCHDRLKSWQRLSAKQRDDVFRYYAESMEFSAKQNEKEMDRIEREEEEKEEQEEEVIVVE